MTNISQLDLLRKFNEKEANYNSEMTKIYGYRYTEYKEKYNLLYEFKQEPDFPPYIMIEQTYKCNLSCPICIHGYDKIKKQFDVNENGSVMPFETYKKIIDEGEKFNCPSVSMMVNDEPLLVKDLEKRVKYAKDHGFMDVIMVSNGNLLTEKRMKSVVESGVTRLLFSIDAASDETYKQVRPGKGSFSKVVENLTRLHKYKEENNLKIPYTRASMVINKENQHEILKFLNFWSDKVDGIEFQTFSYYYNENRNLIPDIKEASKVEDFSCSEPWHKVIIRQNGDVLPCCTFYGYDIPLGNIHKNSIHEIFNSKGFKDIREDVKNKDYRINACETCANSLYKIDVDKLISIN